MEELIDHQQRKRAMILDAEGAMVDLLHRDRVPSEKIPEGYQNQWDAYCIDHPGDGGHRILSKAEFHKFYNWLREVGRDEPEL